jgi:peptidylprolyl isomerase
MRQTGGVRRTIPALLSTGLLALSLTACTSGAGSSSGPSDGASPQPASSEAAAPCAPAASGDASEGIEVSGDPGAAPTVTVSAPLNVDETQRTVLTEGEGEALAAGGRATIEYTIVDAKTGKTAATSAYDGSDALSLTLGQSIPGLDAVLCEAVEGSRIVGVIPPAEAWGDSGQESLGIAGGDSVVFVVDVTKIVPPIVAEDLASMQGMPTVTFADDGTPTITIPDADPPKTSRLGIIEKGDGEVVPAGANVTVDYEGVNWRTGEVFDSSYDRGEPATFVTNQVVNGFRAALEGQTVGSTLLLVAAPVDGYGEAGSGDKIGPGDTIVFVVHIQSIAG